jgi:hypothetical protein
VTAPPDLDPDLDDATDSSPPVAIDTRSQALRYSVLKLMSQSPAHARHAILRGGGEQTLARRLGSGTHALLLGGEVQISSGLGNENVTAGIKALNAGESVCVYPGAVRNGNAWRAFLKEHDGQTILTAREYEQTARAHELEKAGVCLVSAEQYERANRMADSIRACRLACDVLLGPGAFREQRIDWEWSGRAWRSTPDAYEFRTLGELKTTRCADPARFHWDALRMHYHVQGAVYRRAILETTGVRIRDFYLFAVESVEPYVVTPFKFTERSLEHGDRLAKEWHARFLMCEETGEWPGYTASVADLDVYDPEDEAAMEVERAMANDSGERAAVNF